MVWETCCLTYRWRSPTLDPFGRGMHHGALSFSIAATLHRVLGIAAAISPGNCQRWEGGAQNIGRATRVKLCKNSCEANKNRKRRFGFWRMALFRGYLKLVLLAFNTDCCYRYCSLNLYGSLEFSIDGFYAMPEICLFGCRVPRKSRSLHIVSTYI